MIKIPVSNLKKFFQKASPIHPHNVLPICDYIAIRVIDESTIKLTKHAINSWVDFETTATVSGETEGFCVFGKTLHEAVKYAADKEIKIEVKGKKVVITSGVDVDTCALEPLSNFPSVQSNKGEEKISLNEDMLEGLVIAKNHAAPIKDGTNWMSYIHVKKGDKTAIIAATNNDAGFFKKLEDEFPDTAFEAAQIDAISGSPFVVYSSTEKYHFFEAENVLYGYTKPGMGVFDSTTLWDKLKESDGFHVKKSDIISFCEKVISVNTSSIPPVIVLKDAKDSIELDYKDTSGNQGVNRKNGKIFPTTEVQPKSFITALVLLSVDEVVLTKLEGKILITSEEDNTFKGLVSELANEQNK